MNRPQTPPRRLLVILAATVLALAGCSGGDGDTEAPPGKAGSGPAGSPSAPDGSAQGAGLVTVRTEVGSVSRPKTWQPGPTTSGQDASFLIENESGEVVGQMDVIVNTVTPGTPADAVAASIQGARLPQLPSLRHDRREFVEVPGAESAFLTESHYTTADTGRAARSIDVVAVREDGRFLLTRISALAEVYAAERFQRIVDTMRLRSGVSS